MTVVTALRLAIAALRRNVLRSVLTTLGITVGIAAVMCTVALGEGSAEQMRRQLLELGDNFVWIEAGGRNVGGVRTGSGASPTLVDADMHAIQEFVPAVTACTPQVDSRVQIVFRNQNWSTTYRGVSPEYLTIRSWMIDRGAIFSQQHVDLRANVCVIGKTIVDMLFGDDDPVGQIVRVHNLPFKVIGVLRSKGVSSSGQDQDDTIVMPYTTAQRKIRGIHWVDDIMCSVTSPDEVMKTQESIVSVLRVRHRLAPNAENDFNIRTPQETMRLRTETTRTLASMISAVASVSLLVGGIGIMNIMLVSVAERTREIGIRLATGARERDVRRQFLSEAVMLSVLGGVAGIALGVVGSRVLGSTLGWPMRVSPQTIVIATACATIAGVVFGYYPARRAAALDPIDALRSE
jgi:putative ABC transport system permease protein